MFASHGAGGHDTHTPASLSLGFEPLNLGVGGVEGAAKTRRRVGKKGAGSSCLFSRKALPNQRESRARGWLFLIF